MGFGKSDQKNIPVVGFLTCNDCDVLRAKTGVYRRVTHRTIIPPTPAAMSKLGLEGCDLCCQLGNVLLSGHGGVLAQGLQGLSFLLLSGCAQDQERTQHPGTCGALMYL